MKNIQSMNFISNFYCDKIVNGTIVCIPSIYIQEVYYSEDCILNKTRKGKKTELVEKQNRICAQFWTHSVNTSLYWSLYQYFSSLMYYTLNKYNVGVNWKYIRIILNCCSNFGCFCGWRNKFVVINGIRCLNYFSFFEFVTTYFSDYLKDYL